MDKKKILVVDDTDWNRDLLVQLLEENYAVLEAVDGEQGIKATEQEKPDLILMDLGMPVMDGLEATKQIMAYSPVPILIMTMSAEYMNNLNLPFEAISYGALDVIGKLDIQGIPGAESPTVDLSQRLKTLSSVKVISHPLAKFERLRQRRPFDKKMQSEGEPIVAIASSTGGPQALLTVLKALPKDFPCGVVIVQHISAGFAQGLADWINREVELTVKLAVDGESIEPGIAYICPSGVQLRIKKERCFHLTQEPACHGHKPSATILFESVAEVYGNRAIGVILTGMGADGSTGLQKLHAASGKVLAQDEATSVVFGMPKAAIDLGVVDWVLPIDQIAPQLLKILNLPVWTPL